MADVNSLPQDVSADSEDMVVRVSPDNSLVINVSGNVGLNTMSPNTPIQWTTDNMSTNYAISYQNSADSYHFAMQSGFSKVPHEDLDLRDIWRD
jgi:hypothetical protein